MIGLDRLPAGVVSNNKNSKFLLGLRWINFCQLERAGGIVRKKLKLFWKVYLYECVTQLLSEAGMFNNVNEVKCMAIHYFVLH